MNTADFDYNLPENFIASKPLEKRSNSRLLVVHNDGKIEHRTFTDIINYLSEGDLLILNNSKVFPAKLIGKRNNGKPIEILLVKENKDFSWEVLTKGKHTGKVYFADNFQAEIIDGSIAKFEFKGNFNELIWKYGYMPLPPYIKRKPDKSDLETYQTTYAKNEGSIAAPTAGLHFTKELLSEIQSKGIKIRELTLHVGIGTFKSIRTEKIEDHAMEKEHFEIESQLIKEIIQAKKAGNKIFAVGTTTTRVLEGFISNRCNTFSMNGKIKGDTDIFIYPGYKFKIIDSLITNFHLPKSTPLMLASAKCGIELLFKAYSEAISLGYRFLSYGDAMLIL